MIYLWEQDTRLFNVAIVVPMGVLLPLEREEKRKHVLPFTQDSRLTNRQPFAQSVWFLCLFNCFFFLIYFILILLVIHFLIDVIHCKLCRKPSLRLFVIIFIFLWYQSREMYDRTSSPITVRTAQYLLLLHIIFYYIDTSVLVENIPLVKFIKATSGTRVLYFP